MKYGNVALWKKMLGGVSGPLGCKLGIHQLAMMDHFRLVK